MKRTLILTLFVLVTFFFAGCDIVSDKKEEDKITTGTITVNANYTDSIADTNTGGTQQIYVYLYKTVPVDGRQTPDYQGSSVVVTSGTGYTITISDIEPGDYYVLVFYDDKSHTNGVAGRYDSYVFYDGKSNPTTADLITVGADTDQDFTINFDDTYLFNSDATFL